MPRRNTIFCQSLTKGGRNDYVPVTLERAGKGLSKMFAMQRFLGRGKPDRKVNPIANQSVDKKSRFDEIESPKLKYALI